MDNTEVNYLNRRAFLKALSTTVLAGAGSGCCTIRCAEGLPVDQSLRLQLVRWPDRLYVDIECVGFCVTKRRRRSYLTPVVGESRRQLTFLFPPQHFAEETIEVTDNALPMRITVAVLQRLALIPGGPSRLVFTVPDHLGSIELSIESLLDWSRFELRQPDLQGIADDLATSKRHFIGLDWFQERELKELSIVELPWGVYLQPTTGQPFPAQWTHAPSPVTRNGQTQLWFSSMQSVLGPEEPLAFEVLDVRGLEWKSHDTSTSPTLTIYESGTGYATAVERSPSTNWDRLELAASLSRRFPYTGDPLNNIDTGELRFDNACTGACYVPGRSIFVHTFGISSLGGWLDLETEWEPKPGCALKAWNHHASFGRDHYVKYERKGFLYPFGIPAVLVILSEREFVRDDEGHYVAPLFKQAFIQIPQPNALTIEHPESPFASLSITTSRTPPLDAPRYRDPNNPTGPTLPGSVSDYAKCDYFLPEVGGAPFAFEHLGIDHASKSAKSRMPMFFVSNKAISSNGLIAEPGSSPVPPQLPPPVCAVPNIPGKFEPINCGQIDAAALGLRAIDVAWQGASHRFAKYDRTPVALAPEATTGDTTNDLEWVEWVRGQVPKLEPDGVAIRPFIPRARTVKLSLPAMRQFSSQATYMLATYRDLRSEGQCRLDPEPVEADAAYGSNVLRPNDAGNRMGAYLHVLPLDPVLPTEFANYPFDPSATSVEEKVRNLYFGKSVGSPHPIPAVLFENLRNEVQFGIESGSDSLGAVSTPDSPIGLLTRSQGPFGDAVVDPRRWDEAGPHDQFAIPESRIDYVSYRLTQRSEGSNQLLVPFEPLGSTACRTLASLYPTHTKSEAIQFFGLDANDQSGLPALTDLGSLFGVDAEILPGIRLSRVLQEFAFGSKNLDEGEGTAASSVPRWNYRITGLDGLMKLFGDGVGQIGAAEIASLAEARSEIPEPSRRLNFGVEASLDWETRSLSELDLGFMAFIPMDDAALRLHASAAVAIGQGNPVIVADAELTDFRVVALKCLDVQFARVAFSIDGAGNKTFSPEVAQVIFTGPLSFINNLTRLLKGLEDEFGIVLSVTPQEVSVSQKIMIPPGNGAQPGGTLQVGPAVITNLNFNWGVRIPLIGRSAVAVAFGLASREDPLTIFIPPFYGGKAHALIEVTTKGVRLFEVSMEYGALVLVKYSIAEGEVSIMGGIFFRIARDASGTETFTIVAYVKITGRLEVAKLITFCGLVMVSMTYEKGSQEGTKIAGQSTITVSMKIGFVRVSYSFTARHEENRNDGETVTPTAVSLTARKDEAPTVRGEQHYWFNDPTEDAAWASFVAAYAR